MYGLVYITDVHGDSDHGPKFTLARNKNGIEVWEHADFAARVAEARQRAFGVYVRTVPIPFAGSIRAPLARISQHNRRIA